MAAAHDERDTLRRLVDWGQAQPMVRAMIMTSSRAVPGAPVDAFSDYDVILAVRDVRAYHGSRAWLEAFGPVLAAYRDPIALDRGCASSGYVTQYESGLKIDFGLWAVELLQRIVATPELPAEFDAGYRVLLDKDQLTAGLKPPTYRAYIPQPPTEEQYCTAVEEIFLEAAYVAKYLLRDDLVAAKHVLDYYMKQEQLLPMLVWRSEIDRGWSVKPGPYGRRLKQWLRPDLWAELETTYTGADLEANWRALFAELALFRKVAREVGVLLGYDYPEDLDRRNSAYLQRVRSGAGS